MSQHQEITPMSQALSQTQSQLDRLQAIINYPDANEDDYMTTTEDEYEDDEIDSEFSYELTAQEQWEESLKQINGLVNFIIFPMIGKVLGRRFSHLLWRRIADWWFI
ncbi:uncharacterized protein RJT20DRAFT_141015 [Scheffersomyces xylosifermentans]|uniref:uncharacterized protein n=1 Tax=Scheffersomyces xylosifermentans TaxID=1304137 RepID=UPI00315DBB5B